MLKQKILLIVACIMLLVPASHNAGAAGFADVTCTSASDLKLNVPVTTTPTGGPTCFNISLSSITSLLTITLEPIQGTFDLYMGSSNSLTEANNKLNLAYTLDRREVYAFKNIRGDFTIAVIPVSPGSSGSRFSIKIAGPDRPQGSQTFCSDTYCSGSYPQYPQTSVPINLQSGDHIIFPFPFNLNCSARITARATWSGSAKELALILNGPTRPDLQDPVAPYARKDGPSPLVIEYTVTSADVQRGASWQSWQVSLVNFSGGIAAGVNFTYLGSSRCLPLTAQATARPSPTSLSVETPLACTGAPHPVRFKVGQPISVCTKVDTLALRARPAGDVMMRLVPRSTLTITGGPSCASNVIWWKVKTDSNKIGWVMDGSDDRDEFYICAAP